MSKRSEYRRMMKALQDLDRVDAGKAPRTHLRPEVRSATERWVHGNTSKVASTYAKGVPGADNVVPLRRRKSRRGWLILLLVAALVIGGIVLSDSWAYLTRTDQRQLPAVKVTTHGRYAFEQKDAASTPITYDPCKVIRYTVNSDLAPTASDGIIGSAVAEVSRLTGLKFQYAGDTHEPVQYSSRVAPGVIVGAYPPVEIAWSSPDDFAKLKGDVVGFGGSTYIHGDGIAERYVTGSVALRADRLAEMLHQPDGRNEVRAVVLHELGHVMGLGHVNDTSEIMNPSVSKQFDYGPGDRAGLALLGQGPCS